MSFHEITLIGNLGRDPELKYQPNGQAVVNMNVASNRVYTNDGGEKVTETIWVRVAAWGKMAEACNQYLNKGSKVFIKGRLVADKETGSPRTFTRNDGSTGASFEVTASKVLFLDKAEKSDYQNPNPIDGGDELAF